MNRPASIDTLEGQVDAHEVSTSMRTWVMGRDSSGKVILLDSQVPITGLDVRNGEHHEAALARARQACPGGSDWTVFDETHPAGQRLAALERAAEPVQVVMHTEGGVIHEVIASGQLQLLVLDEDVEGVDEDQIWAVDGSKLAYPSYFGFEDSGSDEQAQRARTTLDRFARERLEEDSDRASGAPSMR